MKTGEAEWVRQEMGKWTASGRLRMAGALCWRGKCDLCRVRAFLSSPHSLSLVVSLSFAAITITRAITKA